MTRFLIVRHGLSEGNRAKIYQGQLDVPLAPQGHMQAEKTAVYLAEHYSINAIYASDLTRTCQTVQPLADRLGLPIHTCRDLREIDVGVWQGKSFEEVQREFPAEYMHYINDPDTFHFVDGEDVATLVRRSLLALARIAKENDGKTVVIGTHGGVIRALLATWNGLNVKRIKEITPIANCSITVADYENGSIRLVQVASVAHLTNLESQDQKSALV